MLLVFYEEVPPLIAWVLRGSLLLKVTVKIVFGE
jgi:hypothetical protein